MINDLSFNQDYSCISISTDEYHKIYQCDPFGEFYSSSKVGRKRSISNSMDATDLRQQQEQSLQPTKYLKMLFSTSLTIIVPKSSLGNKLLQIYNLKQNLKICELTFQNDIMDIRLNKKRLIVFLQHEEIHIYDLSCVKLVKILKVNLPNTIVGDLSPNGMLVVPLAIVQDWFEDDIHNLIEFSKTSKIKKNTTIKDLQKEDGWLVIYDTNELKPVKIFKAHDSKLVKIAVSNDSSKITTASTKGTIIRVFYLNEEQKITKITNLRRGHNLANITSLTFNNDNSIIGCSSNNDTIHLFKLNSQETVETSSLPEEDSDEDINENLANLLISKHEELADNKFYNLFNNTYTKKIIKKLPMKDYIENLIWEQPKRSFAYIKLLENHSNVEIGFHNDYILIASYDTGILYQYNLPKISTTKSPKLEPVEKREECVLLNQYNMLYG